jgi:arabinofuranosyltransferase
VNRSPTSSALVPRPELLWIFLGTTAVLAALVARFNFVSDDAFILFRYSKNFAAGLGLVYNPGTSPPVEGYSEFLWAVLLGGVEKLGLEITLWARLLTIAGSIVLLFQILTFAGLKLGLGRVGLVAAGLFFATNPTVGVWTTGGLSSSLFALSIFMCFRALFDDPASPRGWSAGFWGTATCLFRADGPFWIVVLLFVALVAHLLASRNDADQERAEPVFFPAFLRGCLVLIVAGSVFIAWRWNTYGDYLPNTARAKVGMSAVSLERGAKYLLHYWAVLPAALITFGFGLVHLLGCLRRWGRIDALGVAFLMAAATFAYSIIVGGDFMAMGRFFLPAIPFLALLFGVMVERIQMASKNFGLTVAAILVVSNVAPAADVYFSPASLRESLGFRWSSGKYTSEFKFWQGMRDRCDEWSLIGKGLALHRSPTESIALGPIGAVGYYSGMKIYDLYGLTNKEVLEASTPASSRSTPGHDRLVDPSFFDRFEPTWRSAKLSWPGASKGGLAQIAENPKNELFPLPEKGGFGRDRFLILERW